MWTSCFKNTPSVVIIESLKDSQNFNQWLLVVIFITSKETIRARLWILTLGLSANKRSVSLSSRNINLWKIECNQSCFLNDQAVRNAVVIQINAEIKAGFWEKLKRVQHSKSVKSTVPVIWFVWYIILCKT